eukprot:1584500-Karenia_brevis.AAC.1
MTSMMDRRRMPSKNGTNCESAFFVFMSSPKWSEVVPAVAVRSLFATDHIASSLETRPVAPPMVKLYRRDDSLRPL